MMLSSQTEAPWHLHIADGCRTRIWRSWRRPGKTARQRLDVELDEIGNRRLGMPEQVQIVDNIDTEEVLG
jgi:hypothetical protein